MAGLLRRPARQQRFDTATYQGGAIMKPQYHFETDKYKREKNHPGGPAATPAKRRAQHEARKQREIELNLKEARQLQTIIIKLEREAANLDDSINSELALSGVREPSHFAYPISARTMQARRENLRHTIAALKGRLSSVSQPMAEPSSAAKINAPHPLHLAARFDSN
jgi:flagellar FliJ protein